MIFVVVTHRVKEQPVRQAAMFLEQLVLTFADVSETNVRADAAKVGERRLQKSKQLIDDLKATGKASYEGVSKG